ncbi:MAG: C39 family peptidase [Candidatus Levybacteria bacterium]|nr:C39 family peptidase [Candidatus Levybacteria bacterium]
MRNWKIIVAGSVLFSLYTIFWFWFFDTPKPPKNIVKFPQKQFAFDPAGNSNLVLGAKSDPKLVFPPSYEIFLTPRKQAFNLSCEFAVASSIIFHFTNNPNLAVNNELTAEKTLINKVAISKNPNVGLRMGNTSNSESLYANLDKGFGGSEYYGIHAPPFFDLFENYRLISKPIYINNSTVSSIQRAISSGHLVMAWIKIGYEKSIDDALSYGKVKVVKGEHSVVINGYDESGVIVMDPALGLERHVGYQSLMDASGNFPIPFLEVYKSEDSKAYDLIIGFDTPTEINRSIPKIFVENGAGDVGVANQMRDILKDFGYNVVGISNADNFDYLDINIQTKKDFSDFLYILKKDIKVASFIVASASANLAEDDAKDIVIIVGK